MKLEWDEAKRAATLELRGLDFAAAHDVFMGVSLTIEDDRRDYGERRYQTVGTLYGRIVMVVWTPREERRRIVSMRECNERESDRYHATVARGG